MQELINYLSKLVFEHTQCKALEVTGTDFINAVGANEDDINIKCVEIKNRTGVTILANINQSDPFPIDDKEDRLVYVSKLSDVEIARESSSGAVIVHLIYER
jgi:hypothetical protein